MSGGVAAVGATRGPTAPDEPLLIQLLRYGIVSVIALGADFGTLIALIEMAGWHYLYAAAAGFIIGLVLNYVLSVRCVFAKRTLTNPWTEFAIFVAIGVVGLGFNEVVMWLLTAGLGLHYVGSKSASAIVVFLWNFGARKVALFS